VWWRMQSRRHPSAGVKSAPFFLSGNFIPWSW
jgi:hypothetical protein